VNAPSFWKDKYSALKELPDYAIAEIQRDAREGMVPVEDVEVLYEATKTMMTHSEPESTRRYVATQALTQFRAKHPNLFTK